MHVLIALLAQAAQPEQQVVTLSYDDIYALQRHADEICPATLGEEESQGEGAAKVLRILREHGYVGPKLSLMEAVCGQWRKGYGAGRRRGSAEM